MAEARNRGTFDERREAAWKMMDDIRAAYDKQLEGAEQIEALAKEKVKVIVDSTIKRFADRGHPLLTADYSQLEEHFSRVVAQPAWPWPKSEDY